MEERRYPLREAQEILGISERTIHRWIKSGKLKSYKPGRDHQIPESAIRKVIEESEVYPKVQASLWPEEPERRDPYTPWLEFVERYASRWEEKAARQDVDLGSATEFVDTVEALYDTLASLNVEEKRVLPAQEVPDYWGRPEARTGVAIERLIALFQAVEEAAVGVSEGSELEQWRQARARIIDEVSAETG